MANPVLKIQRELAEWRAQGTALIDKAEAEDRDLTEAEQAEYTEIKGEIDSLNARMERAQERQQWERTEAEVIDPGKTASDDGEGKKVPAQAKDHTPPKLFETFGEQLKAIQLAGTSGGSVDNRLLEIQSAATGMGEANPSEGGWLIQTDHADEILKHVWTTGQLSSRVSRRTLTTSADSVSFLAIKETSRATGSRYGGVQSYWVDEGTAPTASSLTFRKVKLTVNKLGCLGYVTSELMADAPLAAQELTMAFSEEINFAVENSFYRGTGAGQPLGMLAHASAIDVTKETGQDATTIVYENLIKMWARLYSRSRANAVWFINQDCEPQLDLLFQAVGTGGIPPNFITYDQQGVMRIKGRPVIPLEYCSTLGTTGDIMLCDPSQYKAADKGGIRQNASIHVRFIQDEMTFRAFYRIDGQPTWESAVTPFQGSNTQSPIITLATRS